MKTILQLKSLEKTETSQREKNHILETNHPTALKFEKNLFFLGFLIVKLFSEINFDSPYDFFSGLFKVFVFAIENSSLFADNFG